MSNYNSSMIHRVGLNEYILCEPDVQRANGDIMLITKPEYQTSALTTPAPTAPSPPIHPQQQVALSPVQ